jgi:uncharacterized membrane protein YbhN (UPF0104 family)
LKHSAGRAPWRRILYTTGIVVGLGLLAQQVWQGIAALQQAQACVARPSFGAAVLAAYIAAYFVQMAAWALIMRSLHAPLRPQAVLEGYALAFLPRYIPGTVWGYLSRNEWLAQNHGVGYGVSTAASLIEAAMLLASAMTLGALYWLPTYWPHPLVMPAIITGALVAVALIWYVTPLLTARFSKGEAQPSSHNTGRQSALLWLVTTTLLYLLFWLLQGAALVAITHTLCGALTLPLSAATGASALSWAIGFLILFVPAGLGVREWSLGTLLVTFAALPSGEATLLAVVSRAGLVAAEVLVLLIGLNTQLLARWNRRNLAIDDSTFK